jgi:hypothetical protein
LTRTFLTMGVLTTLVIGGTLAAVGIARTGENLSSVVEARYSYSLAEFVGRTVKITEEDCALISQSLAERQLPTFSKILGWNKTLNTLTTTQERQDWFVQEKELTSEIQSQSTYGVKDYLESQYTIQTEGLADLMLVQAEPTIYSAVKSRELGDYSGPVVDIGWQSQLTSQIRAACLQKANEIALNSKERFSDELVDLGSTLLSLKGSGWAPQGFTRIGMLAAYSPDTVRTNCSDSSPRGCSIISIVTPVQCSLEIVVEFGIGRDVVEAVTQRIRTVANKVQEVEIPRRRTDKVDNYEVVSGTCS